MSKVVTRWKKYQPGTIRIRNSPKARSGNRGRNKQNRLRDDEVQTRESVTETKLESQAWSTNTLARIERCLNNLATRCKWLAGARCADESQVGIVQIATMTPAVQPVPTSANERVKKKMSAGAELGNKPKTYHFHPEWEEYFFSPTMSYSNCVCLICQSKCVCLICPNVINQSHLDCS